ncbi:hypothetical protein [Ureibacillus manganicus]|nr:hypothetical protein [Ureibacillus manganicus]
MSQYENIKALYEDAILYDEPYTAHLIYYLQKKGEINLQDPVSKLDEIMLTDAEELELKNLRIKDVLNMRPVKIYAIQCSERSYAFYLAQNVLDARELHFKHYGQWVKKVHCCYNQMIDKSLYCPEVKRYKNFRELIGEAEEFPWYVGEVNIPKGTHHNIIIK